MKKNRLFFYLYGLILLVGIFWVNCEAIPNKEITFTLKNDTPTAVAIETDIGRVVMDISSSYQFSKAEGTRIYLLVDNHSPRLLLTVHKDMEGKTFKISELI